MRDDMLPILLVSDDVDHFEAKIEEILKYQVCGIILSSDTPPGEVARHIALQGVPWIAVNKDKAAAHFDRVICDGATAARQTVHLFNSKGLGCLVAVRTGNNSFTVNQRIDAFLAKAQKLGLEIHELTVPDMSYGCGVEAADALKQLDLPRGNMGVFCAADYLALGFIDQIKLVHGYNLPRDLQFIGFDDIPEASRKPYELTTFKHDTRKMAKACVDLLQARIANPDDQEQSIIVECQIAERSSTVGSNAVS